LTGRGYIAGLACGLWATGVLPGLAEGTSKVVVELFTSQGCSSCPPADAYLGQLASEPDVIALALHVDYWDYIGWTDQFGSPQFTERQKAYARAEGHRTIYTPQMIVNGVERVEGANPEKVESDIRQHLSQPQPVSLTLARQGSSLSIKAAADGALPGPVRVQLVRYQPMESVSIDYGENAGSVVDYHNIVTEWRVLGIWTGEGPLELTAPLTGDGPWVVILQSEGPGAILAAAELK
jgi:hypothetical protein